MPAMPSLSVPLRLVGGALLTFSLLSGQTLAQTAPAPTAPTPASPVQTSPAPAQTAPAPTAPATPSQAAPRAAVPTSAATSRTVSVLSVAISKAVKGQMVSCPKTLKVSAAAVCLYVKSGAAPLKPTVKSAVGSRALGDWKASGQSSGLVIQEAGQPSALVMLTPLAAQETLILVEAVQARPKAASAPKVSVPAGVVKGLPYVLDSDLAGVVNVINLGGGRYRLNAAGQTALTITAGSKTAQRPGGNVQLPQTPLTDGTRLIYPVEDLRALGCTVTDNPNGITIACGTDSMGVKPIVF